MNEQRFSILHPLLAIAGFGLWGYLLIVGQQLTPTTTLALLLLILSMAGLGQLASDIIHVLGGGGFGKGPQHNATEQDRERQRERQRKRERERDRNGGE